MSSHSDEEDLERDPTSEVGFRTDAPHQENVSRGTMSDEKWMLLLENQNRNFLKLMQTIKSPASSSELRFPIFDPNKNEMDARAWISTANMCITDGQYQGAPLMVALSRALQGQASTWFSSMCYPGMTWDDFRRLFISRYDSPEPIASFLLNLNSRKPQENECLASYAATLLTSLMSRFNGLTTEQIAIATVLSHISQFEPRVRRLSFTTDIRTRNHLHQELKAVSYMKRKSNHNEEDEPDHKRNRPTTSHSGGKFYYQKRFGHKSSHYQHTNNSNNYERSKNQSSENIATTKPSNSKPGITCFHCQERGHYASSCPKRKTDSGGAASTSKEKRVDLCIVSAPTGSLRQNDCLHLQLYRDPKDRYKKGQTKASLSLQHFLGFESGFTLDKESNTIAIICQDVTVVLAFETRERLIAWQVKVGSQLGSSREFVVLISGGGGGGGRRLPAGPARVHLQGKRFALTSGVPPRLLGLWELQHLRRYGVVDGRFCFEGGSHCGKGEGLHMLLADRPQEIADAFDLAARGSLPLQRTAASRKSGDTNRTRPSTRLSDTIDQSIPDSASGLYEENFFGEDCGGVSPYWPSNEGSCFDEHDSRVNEIEIGVKPPWSGADHVTLERCSNCLTKLGAVSRSSTVPITPNPQFNPAWTMDAVQENISANVVDSNEYLTPKAIRRNLEGYSCDRPPQRPPKPEHLEQKKLPAALPQQNCRCAANDNVYPTTNPKAGPYENYDIPKATPVEQVDNAEYYDTPKRIKQALTDDLFQVAKSPTAGALVLKKNCGCILKFASKKKPVIVECEENIQPVECPCQKVTSWANNLISLPYCKRDSTSDKISTEVLTSKKIEEMALYATVDVTRKTNRKSGSVTEKETTDPNDTVFTNYQNIEPNNTEFEGPFANYENLEFALSLEYYENAKDLLKKAGVTQSELDALSANLDVAAPELVKKQKICTKCGHTPNQRHHLEQKAKGDEYLLMEPPKDSQPRDLCRTVSTNPGYTPMSPNPNWSQSLKHPVHKTHRVDIEKSLSIPTLNDPQTKTHDFNVASNNNKEATQKRSSSVDSARLLEDLKEFDSSIGSHATSSSLETLRNLAIDNRRSSSPCDNERECYDCCKSSGSENNKTSEESSSKEMPHLRNKHMDNAQIKRSSSVPCKSGGNRDSSSSNDSGVSSCSMKHGVEYTEYEMPLTLGHSRYHYMMHRKLRGNMTGCIHSSLPRKSKSSDPLRDQVMQVHKCNVTAKSSSAEAEVPVLPPKAFKGVLDTHSTSSGTSDMSDYIETLSLTSSQSSSDTPSSMRPGRQPTSTLRPRSGKEYHNLDPLLAACAHRQHYANLPSG